MKPLFTSKEFLSVVEQTFALPENELFERGKPRASALGSDARELAYMMAATEHDRGVGSRSRPDHRLTAEQGRHMEALSSSIIKELGFEVVNSQISLPDDYFVTGHPDGELVRTDGSYPDGLKWGFEHKHPGRWDYIHIIQHGTIRHAEACPKWFLQAVLYGWALGWDMVQFVVVAQDASGIMTEANRNAGSKNPGFRWGDKVQSGERDPKVWTEAFDLRPYYHTLAPAAKKRAEWLANWKERSGDPKDVQLEHSPYDLIGARGANKGVQFPWAFSEWLGHAQADGQSGFRAPPLPEGLTGSWTGEE